MPEYLAPGVYVEETSFRAKTIEGVSTSVGGFIGPTRYGPLLGEPELLTSFTQFEQIYGGIDRLTLRGDATDDLDDTDPTTNYMAHAVRAFFDNGGTKLYVTRVWGHDPDEDEETWGYAQAELAVGGTTEVTLDARFPGDAGNMTVIFAAKISENVFRESGGQKEVSRLREGDVVFIGDTETNDPDRVDGLYQAEKNASDEWVFKSKGVANVEVDDLTVGENVVQVLTVLVSTRGNGRFDVERPWGEFSFSPERSDGLVEYFQASPSSRQRALSLPFAFETDEETPSRIARALFPDLEDALEDEFRKEMDDTTPPEDLRSAREAAQAARLSEHTLEGGHDGLHPAPRDYEGDVVGLVKSGLKAMEDVEDIAFCAAPGYSERLASSDDSTRLEGEQIQQLLLGHADRMRYRLAILDSGPAFAVSEVREQRGRIDSLRGALYYPWVTVVDPLAERGTPRADTELQLPPSGFVAGIYARNDVERGVHKAPANEVVRGAIGLEVTLNKAQQDVLNPDGINAFRFFEGRGYRLWGARCATSDPEWKYVNVRRYFMFLERSIEKGTQWAVFENNSHRLWAKVTRTVEDFLYNQWNNGALFGEKPEEAYFVRCDRTTMTQNDIDNGRLVCLIGVAPVRPAEFVIFRIGQWTADATV